MRMMSIYTAFVGSDSGTIKRVVSKTTEDGTANVSIFSPELVQSKSRNINALLFAGIDGEEEDSILAGFQNGNPELRSVKTGRISHIFPNRNDNLRGMEILRCASPRKLVTCDELGQVTIQRFPQEETQSDSVDSHHQSKRIKTTTTFGNSSDESDHEDVISFSVSSHVSRMRVSPEQKRIVIGGKGVLPKEYDIDNPSKCSFSAKNRKADKYGITPRIFVTDIAYRPESSAFVTSNAYGDVDMYDPRAQGRPVMHWKGVCSKEHLVCLAVNNDGSRIVSGSVGGKVALIDIKKGLSMKETNKEPCYSLLRGSYAGSVRQIAFHPTEKDICFTVSLDRSLRRHNVVNKSFEKEYLKLGLSSVLVSREVGSIQPTEPEESRAIRKVLEDLPTVV